MPKKGMWAVFIAVALCVYASHKYEQRQAYKTGVYMGKAFFTAADLQNRHCLSLRADSFQRGCEVNDLNKDSVMENAMASAKIIPSMSESDVTAIHTGFRDGWRKARIATFANR
jgi:hypothetical protein